MRRRGPAQPGVRGSYSAGLSWGALSFVLNASLGLLSSVVIARLYGISVVGAYTLAMAPMQALWQLSTVREQAAFVRALASLQPREPRVTGLFIAVFAFSSALTLVAAGLAALAVYLLYNGPIAHPDLIGPALAGLVGYLLIFNVAWNLDMVLSGFRAGRELNAVRVHQAALFVVLVAVGGAVAQTVWVLVVATIAAQASSLAHRLVIIRRYLKFPIARAEVREGMRALPDFIRFGLKVTPGELASGVSAQSGTWVLAVVGTLPQVGGYSRAWLLAMRFFELNYRVTEMLFPTLVERRDSGDRPGFDQTLVDTLRYAAVGLLLLAAAGGGAATAVMGIYGEGFGIAADALAVALVVPAVVTLCAVQRHALFAVDRPLLGSASALIGMAATVGATIALTLEFGLVGTASGALIGYSTDLLILSVAVRRHLSTPVTRLWPVRQFAALAAAYAAGFAAARLVDDALDGAVGLLCALPAGAIAYLAVFVALGGVGPRDRVRLRWARERLRRRA